MDNQNERKLDDAIEALKSDQPLAEHVQHARAKVWGKLAGEAPAAPERLRSVEDFQALLVPYMRGELSEARRMLVEDHLSKNPASRRKLDELRGNVRTMAPPATRKSGMRPFVPWAIAAGVLMVAGYLSLDLINQVLAPNGPRAELASVSGEMYKVSAAGLQPVKAGDKLGEKEAVRTAKGSSAVVRLPDGSLIEMNERAELSISGVYTGSTIRLERGNILVQAAKQKRGTLKVATRESVVNVKGTIFAVAAGMRGTQVAVVEGHVVVEQNGKTEDLLPGQVTGSEMNLKRTTVPAQIAWSKDEARYLAMLGEMSEISKQIAALPMPALRTSSKIFAAMPEDTALYAAIPNLSTTIADATKIFESRLEANPALNEWWKSSDVAKAREFAERLRTAGALIGDEIVIGARSNGKGGLGEPFVVAEVKGAQARVGLMKLKGEIPVEIGERYVTAGAKIDLSGGQGAFAASSLGKTVERSYQKGAGWILAMDLEQFMRGHVKNNMRHLMVERRDAGANPDTRATISFDGPRTGIASWLAAPAPMASLDYVSPQAGFALAAVTKDAREMGEEFFAITNANGSRGLNEVESKLGLKVLDDILGPFGGEATMALDGALAPVPSVLFVAEVYDSGRLTTSLRRIAQEMAAQGLTLSEEALNGRTWYRLKAGAMPVELNFTYDRGYVLMGPAREAIVKAIQNRQTGNSLTRSSGFRQLIPADAQVNMSGVIYYNMGPSLRGVLDALKSSGAVPPNQQDAIAKLATNQEAVLIALYAEENQISVASSSGFFGFGLENLLAAGSGAPVLPSILGSVMRQTAPVYMQGNNRR
jgi:hypothetical protein